MKSMRILKSVAAMALLAVACSSGGSNTGGDDGGGLPPPSGAPPHFAVTVPADLNAGVQSTATIDLMDAAGKTVPGYAGTVSLVSSDTAATVPASVTLAAGHGSVQVTFGTIGSQTLTATDAASPSFTGGTATVRVHGLVYTNPPALLGSAVKLVVNAAASNARVVQLDLVANRSVATGFAVAMNLPTTGNRVTLDATPLVEGNIFDPGAAPKAEAARLAGGVVYSGLSQKAAGAGGGATDKSVVAGGTYYSIRLALAPGATVGTVFDGSATIPKFRAAVRDLLGNDTVSQRDFALGTLEVR